MLLLNLRYLIILKVQELFGSKHSSRIPESRPTKFASTIPLVPDLTSLSSAEKLPSNIVSKWNEVAAMIYLGQMGMDSSLALTTLGDHLLASDLIYAAHCW